MPDIQDPESQTRLSVIMFSDIVGYSKMMHEDEELAMTVLGRHNEIIREALKKHEGKEIKVIGDAFLVSFTIVANAVRCAIEIQEQFGKYNESAAEKEKVLVRIGIHMGDIIVKDNDVFGDGVNVASRIEPLAEPGGICISQEVYNLVKHKLDLQVVSLGPKELKNIKDKVEIYEVLVGSITSDAHKAKRRKKQRTYWVYAAVGLLIVAIGIVVAIKTLNKPTMTMTTRILRTGSNEVTDPNISPDGNWIVYVSTDSRQLLNLYVMPASGGDPRNITNDTIFIWKTNPCFSPDASQIAYGCEDGIYIIPTLGGKSRKLVNHGSLLPVWSPDGKHIAFLRQLPSTTLIGMELSVVNPDGTHEAKITEIKPVFSFNVAWSPDSRRLAFLRSFQDSTNGQYSEIFSRNLDDSAEHQITFDKKMIDDFCWASTGEIVFNSTRGGGVGLWVMPEDGGTPKQLTLGAGTDRVPRISRDAKTLVYLNGSETIDLWTLNLRTQQLKQLTFEGALIRSAAYSSDGNKLIYFYLNAYDDSQNAFVISNKDGSEPTRFIPKDRNCTWMNFGMCWSSDMKFVYLNGST
ncbi:MAG TPA: adenylate/guanylate cyclase domain-containing protein, partial [Bacteroidota bacterium]|nr:adenylate/guanylate cyclase domain-containing protein [Bacteroidota bacterium]